MLISKYLDKLRTILLTLLSLIVVLVCSVLFAPIVLAASQTGTATVTLSEGLVLEEVRQLSFGNVLLPTTGTNVVTVDTVGSGNYTSGDVIGTDQSNARYKIVGFSDAVVDITSSDVVSTIPGVTFNAIDHGNSRTLDGSGEAFFKIGGTITVDTSAAAGVYNTGQLSYIITVDYP